MKYDIILKQVLNKIKPSKSELSELEAIAKEFIKFLRSLGFDAKLGGSLAKGTITRKQKQEIDIFVSFNNKFEIDNLKKKLRKSFSKKTGEIKIIHGSRDYFRINSNNIIIEIIPIVKVKKPELAENITDLSLLHVAYIRKKIRENPSISDEIRLAKAFCKAQKVYGAESYIRGFSGYSLELLVIYFNRFLKFLKAIQKTKTIDIKKHFKNEQEIKRELNTAKLQSPIILIDPTYKYRNVAAGLNHETFNKFLESANAFLSSPTIDFFKPKEINIKNLKSIAKKQKAKLIQINLETNRQEGDIAGTKMKKFLDFFSEELGRKQQLVLQKEFDYDGKGKKAMGYLIVKEKAEIEVNGPPVGLYEAVEKFRKVKGKTAYKKGNYWYYKEKVNIKNIFKAAKKAGEEMGAGGVMKSF